MRLLFFAGSTREGSFNKKLARLAQHIATAKNNSARYLELEPTRAYAAAVRRFMQAQQ